MRLLDLFCGAGGAAMGYHRAGFTDIVGVDIKPQKRYPFEFVLGDALEYCAEHGHEFDMIHASPPCQAYSAMSHLSNGKHPALIEQTRNMINENIYVIENVPGSPLRDHVILCGSMFDLRLRRHRLFECSPSVLFPPAPCNHNLTAPRSGRKPNDKQFYSVVGHFSDIAGARIAMAIDWMTRDELAQAIPPAYTEYIGGQMLKHMEALT